MRLIIAEKPSLARAIVAALPGHHRERHHIECSDGDVVAWCAGHVLEMAPPGDYSAELETWTLDTLPIVPHDWKHRVTSRELVDSLRKLLRKATRVVHAGDPDREGQLLVDEVLQHLGWKGPTERLLVTDLSPAAVQRALRALEPNERFPPLYEAALARQRADWLYGLDLTRLYTLRARLGGYQGVLSVGSCPDAGARSHRAARSGNRAFRLEAVLPGRRYAPHRRRGRVSGALGRRKGARGGFRSGRSLALAAGG